MTSYKELHGPSVVISGCSVLLALILSTILTVQHLRWYTNPAEQKWIVGVVLMVPVYAIESIVSLCVPKTSLACDILRNCYEAFALYAFGSYLIACLGGEDKVLDLLEYESKKELHEPLIGDEEKQESQPKSFRHFFLHPSALGRDLFSTIKFGLVQYMILKTSCAFLAMLLEIFGVYGDGEFKWNCGYPYITVVLNFSQMWALYCLVQFYNVTHERLKEIKPLAKFISFKAIVFATWWQGVGIAILCYYGILPKGAFQTGLQDFLICIEMAVAAIAHVYVFSARPYRFIPVSDYEEISTHTEKTLIENEESPDKGPTVVEKTETEVKAPGTSITESVQDIVVEGGQQGAQVVEDVKLTINQAMGPVEKGVTKIQESFHQITVGSDDKEETEVEVEEHIEDDLPKGELHVECEQKKTITKNVDETSKQAD